MGISIHKMCRGQGAAYLFAEFSKDLTPSDFVFSAEDEKGVSLPLETYLLDEETSGLSGAALATPLLDTEKVVVSAKSLGDPSMPVWKKAFSRSRIKWSSRFFYKTDWETAHQIRDIDRFTYSNQIHINVGFIYRAPEVEQVILKGIVCAPRDEKDVKISVLKHDGSKLEDPNLYIYGTSSVLYDGVPRNETSFTLRLPDDDSTYCIVAEGSDRCRLGFLCLDQGTRDRLCMDFGPKYYSTCDSNRWNAEYRRHLLKQRILDPADYNYENGPLFSIVVPLYNTKTDLLNELVTSVTDQVYTNWELILVNSTPKNAKLKKALEALTDSRIRVVELEQNLGISENTNAGTRVAKGDYIVFCDHDDVLNKMALARFAKVIVEDPSIDALYSDEDFLQEDGSHVFPHLKSDFNIDLLRAHNYITHLVSVRASLVAELPLRKEFDGAQDYDFLLRLSEKTDKIFHVREVLYHWRMSETSTAKSSGNKSYTDDAGLKALQEHLVRCGLNAQAQSTDINNVYKTTYNVEGDPLVSIIIPNKDSVEVLSRCIDSVEEKTDYRNFEIVVVENNSTDKKTFEYYKQVEAKYDNVKVVYWDGIFNYSQINNFGFKSCSGEYILLLNNDIEVIDPWWLSSMLGYCQREEVGIVGAKLLYPDGTIQHAGVAMIHCDNPHVGGGPFHVFGNLDKHNKGYFNRAILSQDLSMVTGACLLTKRSVYEKLGGLNGNYRVAYNDVDYCLRVRREGLLVVFDAYATLYHYESFSRGSDNLPKNMQRFTTEKGRLMLEWPEYFYDADGYHSRAVFKDNLF